MLVISNNFQWFPMMFKQRNHFVSPWMEKCECMGHIFTPAPKNCSSDNSIRTLDLVLVIKFDVQQSTFEMLWRSSNRTKHVSTPAKHLGITHGLWIKIIDYIKSFHVDAESMSKIFLALFNFDPYNNSLGDLLAKSLRFFFFKYISSLFCKIFDICYLHETFLQRTLRQ